MMILYGRESNKLGAISSPGWGIENYTSISKSATGNTKSFKKEERSKA